MILPLNHFALLFCFLLVRVSMDPSASEQRPFGSERLMLQALLNHQESQRINSGIPFAKNNLQESIESGMIIS
jgi:hypothetical protein